MPDLRRRNQTAISVGGSEEQIEPVYTKVNRQSGLGTPYPTPSEPYGFNRGQPSTAKPPIVLRGQDTRGMRYLWSYGSTRQPVSPLGTGPDIGNAVWSSEFQPEQNRLLDYGFYDLLYRAGYPGFNLGISFRVAKNPQAGLNSPGYNTSLQNTPNRNIIINVLARATNKASNRG